MQTKDTRTRAKSSRASKTAAALAALRTDLGIEVNDFDNTGARDIAHLYRSPRTPPIIQHAIFQIYLDLAKLYKIPLPANCTRTWLSVWPTLIAANQLQGSLPTIIRYTWEPSDEESAELDAEEEEDNYARHVFDLTNDERLPDDVRDLITQGVSDTIDRGEATPMQSFEVFRVAWPLALINNAKTSEGEGGE